MPTDPIANDLAIRLFLFGAALMSVYEGVKLQRPYSFMAWGAATLFFLAGVLLSPLSAVFPAAVSWFGMLAANPLTWLILLILSYLLLRPRVVRPGRGGPDPVVEVMPYDDTPIRTEITRLARQTSAAETGVANLQATMNALAKKLSPIEKDMEQLKSALNDADNYGRTSKEKAEAAYLLVEIECIDYQVDMVKKSAENADRHWKEMAEEMSRPRPPLGGVNDYERKWEMFIHSLTRMVDFRIPGLQIETGSPNYSKNPGKAAPGEDVVTDEERRYDYRRLHEEYLRVKGSLLRFAALLEKKRLETVNKLHSVGRFIR